MNKCAFMRSLSLVGLAPSRTDQIQTHKPSTLEAGCYLARIRINDCGKKAK